MEIDHSETIVRTPGISVLHVAQPLDGGVPAVVTALLRDQVARGLKVSVACPAASSIVEAARSIGAHHYSWEATRAPGWTVVDETRRLRRIVRDVDPDVVHLHSAKAGLAGRLAVRKDRATVFQPHGWSFEAATGLVRRAALAWERHSIRWTSIVVCVSDEERQRGVDMRIRADWRVIANGVDLDMFRFASERERSDARRTLALDVHPLAVCVGRLADEKGQDVLLDAWPLVLDEVPAAQLVLVGDGPNRAKLESRSVTSVRLAGRRDDVAGWLAAADVVVQPSRREGMALTLLEAMATGRTVVATDVPGAREALGDDAGAIVPPEDSNALARALAERLGDRRLAVQEGIAGRRRVARSHDIRDTAAAVTALYDGLR